MLPLHKVPTGLLQLLNLRNVGRGPQALAEEVRPVVDVAEFYASNLLFAGTGAPSVGTIVPELTESLSHTATLRLKACSATLTIGAAAATNVGLSIGLQPGATQALVMLGSIFAPALAAGQVLRVSAIVPNWVVPAGSVLFALASGTAAGADHSLAIQELIENYVSGQ